MDKIFALNNFHFVLENDLDKSFVQAEGWGIRGRFCTPYTIAYLVAYRYGRQRATYYKSP